MFSDDHVRIGDENFFTPRSYHVSSHILSDSLFPYFLPQHSPLPPLSSPLPQTSPSPSSISQPWQYSLKIKTSSYRHYCPDSDFNSTHQWRFPLWRFQEDNRYTCAPTRSDSILHQIESEKHSFQMLKLSCSDSCPIGLLFLPLKISETNQTFSCWKVSFKCLLINHSPFLNPQFCCLVTLSRFLNVTSSVASTLMLISALLIRPTLSLYCTAHVGSDVTSSRALFCTQI